MEEEAKGDETPKSILNEMALANKVNITVVGYHGRKGPKEDPTVMGSAVQFMTCNGGSPILIVKDGKSRETSPNKCFKLGVLIDGSKQSLTALKLLCKMV